MIKIISNKKIVIVNIVIFFMIIFVFSFYKEKINKKSDFKQNETTANQNEVFQKNAYEEQEPWTVYYDERYKFSIDYLAFLDNIVKKDNSITFYGGKDEYWLIKIDIIENTAFLSVDDWVLKKNNECARKCIVVEKEINIDKHKAMVTHWRGEYDSDYTNSNEKTTIFIRNRQLFKLNTRSINHERVWDSFKFDE